MNFLHPIPPPIARDSDQTLALQNLDQVVGDRALAAGRRVTDVVAVGLLQTEAVPIDGRGADVVYDPVGGDTYDRSTKCIAFEGRILIIGFTGGRFAQARTNHVLIKNYSVVGVHWGMYNIVKPEIVRATHDELMRLFEDGKIAPLISETVTLDEVPKALGRLGSRGTYGKLVCEL